MSDIAVMLTAIAIIILAVQVGRLNRKVAELENKLKNK